MPYIQPAARVPLRDGMANPATSGDLNFLITDAILRYMDKRDLNYGVINDVLGALEGAKLEFYRRVAVPYETGKIALNGDVYDRP